MASVYGIVKNHDGYIDVSSSEGQGTSFEVYFPATDKVVAPQDKSGESPAGAVETVLLVDDEEMIIDVGTRMLTRLGYEVLTAANGVEAVETYRANQDRIDFVLLDMVMPKVGGGEVFDRIRAINPAVKVILCSGYSIDGQATDILKRGCNAFIQKPFNLKSLSNQIRAVLDEP